MCLYSSQTAPLVADKDIVCFKILIPVDGKLITPYRDFIFSTNVVVKYDAEELVGEICGVTEVSSGFVQRFT